MKSKATPDRPFDPKVVKQAESLAARYHIAVRRSSDGYVGTVRKYPSVCGYGTTETAAMRTTRDLLKWAIAYLIESGRTPT